MSVVFFFTFFLGTFDMFFDCDRDYASISIVMFI